MTFDLKSVKVTCVTLPKIRCVQVPWKYSKVCGYSDLFPKNLNQRSLTPRWPLTQVCWGRMCDSTQGSFCPSPIKIHQSMWIQWPFFQKCEPKVIDPRWPLTPRLLMSQMWLYPRIIVSKSHGNTSKMWIQWPFFKNVNQRSLTPRWQTWPSLLRSHMCVTLPKDHFVWVPWQYIKVCGYSDQVFFKNVNQRSLTPDDLWPHICWGHKCYSTQGSLCPRPMGIHQCMWIQWSILQKIPHTTTYYTTYYTYNVLELAQFPVTARGCSGVREADLSLDFLLLLQRVVVRGW